MFTQRLTKADRPTSLGAFKPVGHVVVAFADAAHAAAAVAALREAGFQDEDILQYTAAEEKQEMDAMLADVSGVAEFGYEAELMRKYQKAAADGACWLIVYAPDDDPTQRVAELCKLHGAILAEKYNHLSVEDLV
jgi:hypothetical protein